MWKSIHEIVFACPVRSRSDESQVHIVYFGKPVGINNATHEDMQKLFGERYWSCTCEHFNYHGHEGHCHHITYVGSTPEQEGGRVYWEGKTPEYRDEIAYVPNKEILAYDDKNISNIQVVWNNLIPVIIIKSPVLQDGTENVVDEHTARLKSKFLQFPKQPSDDKPKDDNTSKPKSKFAKLPKD